MPYTLVRHHVKDYDHWKTVFASNALWRKASGETHYYLFRDIDDQNLVTVMQEWDDLQQAHRFMRSEELKMRMAQAGVNEAPQIIFLEEMESSFKR